MPEKNRIIITGMSLLDDASGREQCFSCDFDTSWVFKYPSTLLWADEIIVSPTVHELISREVDPTLRSSSWAKIARMFFEAADRLGILSVRDPQGALPEEVMASLAQQAAVDREHLKAKYSNEFEVPEGLAAPGGFYLSGEHYCAPRVYALYFSLALARLWNAQLLLNPQAETYLRHCYDLESYRGLHAADSVAAFSEVCVQHFPEVDILPPEAYGKCQSCSQLGDCRDGFLLRVEADLEEFSTYSGYDEVSRMKEVFNRIVEKLGTGAHPEDVAAEMKQVQAAVQKQLRGVFPKVERWSRLGTMASIPVIVTGVATGSPVLSGVGAGIAGVSQLADQLIKVLASRNRWVCFRQGRKRE